MSSPTLVVKTFVLGQWMTHCYVLHRSDAAAGSPCWLIDAGFEPHEMIDYIRSRQLVPQRAILTHGHLDHIAGLELVRQAFPKVEIAIHRIERDFLVDPVLNLSHYLDEPVVVPPADVLIEGGQTLSLDGLDFEVRHTPGHSPGGITLYHRLAATAIVGDTLFAGGIGRSDFPTSDGQTLLRSIHEQIMTLPDSTRVLPGHGPATTIGRERKHNPYLEG